MQWFKCIIEHVLLPQWLISFLIPKIWMQWCESMLLVCIGEFRQLKLFGKCWRKFTSRVTYWIQSKTFKTKESAQGLLIVKEDLTMPESLILMAATFTVTNMTYTTEIRYSCYKNFYQECKPVCMCGESWTCCNSALLLGGQGWKKQMGHYFRLFSNEYL